MAKRALLILIGGRQIPNLLAAQHLRPDIIFPIASHEALREGNVWTQVKSALQQLCPEGLVEPVEIDGFDLQQARDVCSNALATYPDAEWFFNVTCATKVMSIGVYEIAQKAGKTAWYLDTATHRVVTLVGSPPKSDLYRLSVADYLAIYGRTPDETGEEPPERLISFATYLAHNPSAVLPFRNALEKARMSEPPVLQSRSMWIPKLCKAARDAELLTSYKVRADGFTEYETKGSHLWDFINGKWLEIYAWASARDATCFDDYCYGVRIPGGGAENELDLAATHAATLIIAECKTGRRDKPFDTAYLDKLNSIASMIGGNFVGRVFITNQPIPSDKNQFQSYDDFSNQARARQIVIVTGEHLKDLAQTLRKEVGADAPRVRPTFDRG